MILNNPKWETNQILSTVKSDILKIWLFAIFWNAFIAFAIYAGGQGLLKLFDESPIFYLFLSFPVIGVYLFYKAIKESLAWRQYGQTPLVLDTFPGQLGGAVNGYLDIPIDYDPTHQVRISLSCFHHYTDNSGTESESVIEVLWQDTQLVSTKAAINGSRVHFSFKPPIKLPESKPKGKETFEWNVSFNLPLSASATKRVRQRNNKALKTQAFHRKFIIPVLETSAENIKAAEAVSAPINRVSKINYPNTKTPEISRISEGNQYFFPAFHNKITGLFFVVFGVLLVGFSWFLMGNLAGFIPFTMAIILAIITPIALVLVFLGVFIINHNVTLKVTSQGINVRFGIFGFSFTGKTDIDDIADIVIKKGMTVNDGEMSQVWYDLNMVHANGAITSIGSHLEGSSYAESIRQKIIMDLGSGWIANTTVKLAEKNKFGYMQDKFESFKTFLPFAKVLQKAMPFIIPTALLYDGREFIFSIVSRFL